MLTYLIPLLGLIILCVFWIIFQRWLARNNSDYQGYKAGCGSCSRSASCTEAKNDNSELD